ncbi:MAG TPA: DUF1501 domain-containing protein [Gemmataceae bacterium]|nr:DUF1501 domain-containing protein [Gemmataceae bacterium]
MHSTVHRRQALFALANGFGGLALAHLLATDAAADSPRPEFNGGLHHPAKARRVIQLFMNGGASQMDTFDFKPELAKRHGQKFDPGGGAKVEAVTSVPGNVMKSPFDFAQHGGCGRWVSSVFPHLVRHVDDIAFLMSVRSKTNVHGPASYLMNTGFTLPGFPCMGAWLSYGLGRMTDDLPTFVVLPDPRGLPYNAQGNFSAGFLPVLHQGTIIRPTAPTPIADLRPPETAKYITPVGEADGRGVLKEMNREHAERHPGDSRLDARIAAYELAARMQLAAPEALDLSRESAFVRDRYGVDDKVTETFGRQCLTARRLVERGVRFVQVWSGAGGPTKNWDNHNNIRTELPAMAAATDRPIAALLADLKQRGLMDDTLVLWNTEFGRHPFSQGADGRDHNGQTSVQWMAGAGVKGGVAYGESDEWSWKGVKSVEVHDLHATVLHLLGIDHERLTFFHNGIGRRLTDVHGHVIKQVLN